MRQDNRASQITEKSAHYPAAASGDQDTKSFTLEIFGNANMDDTIDEEDIEYVEEVIKGTKESTNLTDANNDGTVDEKDVKQIRQIIDGTESELTFIGTTNKITTIDEPAGKIVAVYSNVGEAIRALGAKDRIIGVDGYWQTRYSSFFPDLIKLPHVGGEELDMEAIIELEPDIVILPDWYPADIEDKLDGTDIDVARISLVNAETLRKEMMLLGYVIGEVGNASSYFEWHDKYVDDIMETVSGVPEDEKATVFIDGSEGGLTQREDLSDHFTTWKQAGGRCFTNLIGEENRMVETEWVLGQNPDVIIGCRFDGGYQTDDNSPYKAHYEDIVGLPGFDNVSAVKNDRVYICFGRLGMGLHTPIGTAYAAKWLYPELFEDLDPQAIHKEYIERFCPGLDFDVSEQGVFVYLPSNDS